MRDARSSARSGSARAEPEPREPEPPWGKDTGVQEQPRIPGFVNAHCHAFQRALRGRTEGGDFWAWRETMLELAAAQTPERVRREYVGVYRELRAAGYTAVGEFHYLGLDEGCAAAEAAAEAGGGPVLLHAPLAPGGGGG